ncbi:hypothetical protein GF377_09145 [candidate division GN15 bacterium]|nr:hypothetical protein [candidate division GN15 bacterium]
MADSELNNTRVITVADDPSILGEADKIVYEVWPEFMLHDATLDKHWSRLKTDFPRFQFALWDDVTDQCLAFANSLALHWDQPLDQLPDRGIDWAIEKAMADVDAGREPNIQCALQIMVPPRNQGKQLSGRLVRLMCDIGRRHGLTSLIAPVRPNLKHQYPLFPIENYVSWKTTDGLPFDPWLRVHARLGGEIVRVCPQSMDIRGSVSEWEEWAKMRFPASGRHIVPGALVPVMFDVDSDEGVYIEPNVWTVHQL